MKEDRIELINKTIRILNTIEGKIMDERVSSVSIVDYIRVTRNKLNRVKGELATKSNPERGEG